MTLILAGFAADGSAVLAADRLVSYQAPGAPIVRSADDKLFLVGGCAVASYGAGVNVPATMRSLGQGPQRMPPGDVAVCLAGVFNNAAHHRAFGLLVLGSGLGGGSELWELPIGQGPARLLPRIGDLVARGVEQVVPGQVPPPPDAGQLRGMMLARFNEVVSQVPTAVGPPFDFATLGIDGVFAVARVG